MQRWELNPLSAGYEPVRSPFAFAAVSVAHGSNAAHGGKVDVPTSNAPVASVLQTEWSREASPCSIGHGIYCRPQDCSGVWDLHPPGRLHRPECCWLHYHLGASVLRTAGSSKRISRPDSHRHSLLYERSAFLCLPQRKSGCSREDSHLDPSPSHGDVHDFLHLGSLKTTSCRCRPDPCGLEDRHARCHINDAGNTAVRRTG